MKFVDNPGRPIAESIAIARAREQERGFAAVLDDDFANDIEEIVRNRQIREPESGTDTPELPA
jgi:hypothetical protein